MQQHGSSEWNRRSGVLQVRVQLWRSLRCQLRYIPVFVVRLKHGHECLRKRRPSLTVKSNHSISIGSWASSVQASISLRILSVSDALQMAVFLLIGIVFVYVIPWKDLITLKKAQNEPGAAGVENIAVDVI